MKNYKLNWAIIGILLIIIAIFSYKFTVGQVEPSEDGRFAIKLSKDERNALLLEMRTWLKSTQGILKAATKNDFEEVSKIAKISGMGAEASTPASLFRKLPLEMKMLGFDTRKKFDEIANDGLRLKDQQYTIKQVTNAMNNCIACHATYRFTE